MTVICFIVKGNTQLKAFDEFFEEKKTKQKTLKKAKPQDLGEVKGRNYIQLACSQLGFASRAAFQSCFLSPQLDFSPFIVGWSIINI